MAEKNASRLEAISLLGMLPRVFEPGHSPGSEVWERDLTFRRGVFYRVEAASGAGKSSLCAYLYGLRTDYRGSLLFDGTDASALRLEQWQQLRRTSLAYVPQELDLFGELTALANVELKNSLTRWKSRSQIDTMFSLLGIAGRRDTPVGKMSVGQRQRVALIRALCQPFDFLLLDEPVSHLDETNNRLAARLVAEEALAQGAGVISTSVGNPLLLESCTALRL